MVKTAFLRLVSFDQLIVLDVGVYHQVLLRLEGADSSEH